MEPSTATSSVPPQTTAQSADALFDAVYARLKHLAHNRCARLRDGDSLDTTALVHELYLRVCSGRELTFAHPAQFFAYAGRAMRHLLCDRARNRLRQRNGSELQRVSLANVEHQPSIDTAEGALALEEALQKLEHISPRSAQIVELLYFVGLSIDQVAQMLDLSRRTVDRDWQFARALLNELLA